MNTPFVSIILYIEHYTDHIGRSIESVLSQAYPALELLIVFDTHHAHDIEGHLKKWLDDVRLRVLALECAKAHVSDAIYHRARGTILNFLRSGDCLTPGAVSRVVESLQINHDHLVVYGAASYQDAGGVDVVSFTKIELVSLKQIDSNLLCPSTVFFKRSLLVLLLENQIPIDSAESEYFWLTHFVQFAERISFIETQQLVGQTAEKSDYIDPKCLIRQYSLKEHTRFADDYFKDREAHAYLYQKPFYHPRDCAPGLSNLGQLFAGANLDAGMRVLDFASGSCWLSKILVQMGCQVACCDASANALAIGQALFKRYPPVLDNFEMPDFSVFNGERLDFPDQTFDRIFVNDAFHHIPNTHQVLSEFYRVLKDDGIVCMSEPGRFHSLTEASQYEMKTFNVLENDLVLESIWADAASIGFESIQISPVLRHAYLSLEEYLDCLRGRIPEKINISLVADTTSHSIFFLHKSAATDMHTRITQEDSFDEAWYLKQHPDIAAVVDAGDFKSGWEHYLHHGASEGRVAKKLSVLPLKAH